MGANSHEPGSQEELDLLKAQVLEEHRHELCQDLNPRDHFPYLRSKMILTRDDCQIIDHEITTSQKTSKFLDILQTRGPNGFDEFCESLRIMKCQIHLLTKLNKALENGKREIFAKLSHAHRQVEEDSFTLELPTPSEAGLLTMDSPPDYYQSLDLEKQKLDPTEDPDSYRPDTLENKDWEERLKD